MGIFQRLTALIQRQKETSVDLKHIKELMLMMEKSGITKLRIKDKYEIELERQGEVSHTGSLQMAVNHSSMDLSSKQSSSILPHRHFPSEEKLEEKKVEGKCITAPLVGTVYHAASPENPPFVKVGDPVSENSVVCIIEAMKVMNEVKAGMSGTVAEILVSNGHPVEFGAKLIRIV
ncbi:MAG: acetyl-CoA carboxylase biotin carboxyl carrier protein [Candidatus Rhabdochlamydia sp.]